MSRLVLVITIFLLSLGALYAQDARFSQTMESFKTAFNQQDYDALFELTSEYMQSQINYETLESVMKQYHDAFGNLDSFEFVEQKDDSALFIGHFENGKQRIGMALNEKDLLSGFRFLPTTDANKTASMERNKTSMSLPFKGDWFVFWGGDTKAQNYHVVSTAQKNAFDIVMLGDNNRSYKNKGLYNEDYYAFGQPLYAVCDAVAVKVITGIEDNIPGQMNSVDALGNAIILKTANDEYIVYAHFKNSTIAIKEGDTVSRGQYLGDCGNSGNSSEAHIHFHLQDGPNVVNAIGIKCFFDQIIVNGELKEDYSPVRLEKISAPQN
ncbi:MAG: peptidoglycan DD-metalloendopeptidase family protein [Gilvibacter sp.]